MGGRERKTGGGFAGLRWQDSPLTVEEIAARFDELYQEAPDPADISRPIGAFCEQRDGARVSLSVFVPSCLPCDILLAALPLVLFAVLLLPCSVCLSMLLPLC